jgi:hypothetical protein
VSQAEAAADAAQQAGFMVLADAEETKQAAQAASIPP